MSDSFVIQWTAVHQTPLSMGFPRQKYWSRLPFLGPGDLLNPGTELASFALAGGLSLSHLGSPAPTVGGFPEFELPLGAGSLNNAFPALYLDPKGCTPNFPREG